MKAEIVIAIFASTLLCCLSIGNGLEDRKPMRNAIAKMRRWRVDLDRIINENQLKGLYSPNIYWETTSFFPSLLSSIGLTEEKFSNVPNGALMSEDFLELGMEYHFIKSAWWRVIAQIDFQGPKTQGYDDANSISQQIQRHDLLYTQYHQALHSFLRVVEVHDFKSSYSKIGIIRHQYVPNLVQATSEMRNSAKELERNIMELLISNNIITENDTEESLTTFFDERVPELIEYTARQLSQSPDKYHRSKEYLEFGSVYHEREWRLCQFIGIQFYLLSQKAHGFHNYMENSNVFMEFAEKHRGLFNEYKTSSDKFQQPVSSTADEKIDVLTSDMGNEHSASLPLAYNSLTGQLQFQESTLIVEDYLDQVATRIEAHQQCHKNEQHKALQQQLAGEAFIVTNSPKNDFRLPNSDFETAQRVFGDGIYLDAFLPTASNSIIQNIVSGDKGIASKPDKVPKEEAETMPFHELQSKGCDIDIPPPLCTMGVVADEFQEDADTKNEDNLPILEEARKKRRQKAQSRYKYRDVALNCHFAYASLVRDVINLCIHSRFDLEKSIEEHVPIRSKSIWKTKNKSYHGFPLELLNLLQKIGITDGQLSKSPDGTLVGDDFLELAMEYNHVKGTWYKLHALEIGGIPYPISVKDQESPMTTDTANKHSEEHALWQKQYAEALETHWDNCGTGITELDHDLPEVSHDGDKIQSIIDMKRATSALNAPRKAAGTEKVQSKTATTYVSRIKYRETWMPAFIKYTARHLSQLPDRHPRSKSFLEFAYAYNKRQTGWYKSIANTIQEFSVSEGGNFNFILNKARGLFEKHKFLLDKYELAMRQPSALQIGEGINTVVDEEALLGSIKDFLETAAERKKNVVEKCIGLSSIWKAANSLSSESLQEICVLPLKLIGMTASFFEKRAMCRPFARLTYHTAVYKEAKWRALNALFVHMKIEQLNLKTKEPLLARLVNVLPFMEHHLKMRAHYEEPSRTIEVFLLPYVNSVGEEGELRRFKNAVFHCVLASSIRFNPSIEETIKVLKDAQKLARLERASTKLPSIDILNRPLTSDLSPDFLQLAMAYHSLLIKTLQHHKSIAETLKTSKDLIADFKWMSKHERVYQALLKLLKNHIDLEKKGRSAIFMQQCTSSGEYSRQTSTEMNDVQPNGSPIDFDVMVRGTNLKYGIKRGLEEIGGSSSVVYTGVATASHTLDSSNKRVKYS